MPCHYISKDEIMNDAGSFTLQKKFDWLLSFIVGTISPMFYQELDFNGF